MFTDSFSGKEIRRDTPTNFRKEKRRELKADEVTKMAFEGLYLLKEEYDNALQYLNELIIFSV